MGRWWVRYSMSGRDIPAPMCSSPGSARDEDKCAGHCCDASVADGSVHCEQKYFYINLATAYLPVTNYHVYQSTKDKAQELQYCVHVAFFHIKKRAQQQASRAASALLPTSPYKSPHSAGCPPTRRRTHSTARPSLTCWPTTRTHARTSPCAPPTGASPCRMRS
jgi:hypothetical protein